MTRQPRRQDSTTLRPIPQTFGATTRRWQFIEPTESTRSARVVIVDPQPRAAKSTQPETAPKKSSEL